MRRTRREVMPLIKLTEKSPIKDAVPAPVTKVRRTRKPKYIVDDTNEAVARCQQMFSKYNWKCVTTEQQLLDYIGEDKEFGFDTETTGLFWKLDSLVGLSLGREEDCIYIPISHKVGKNYQGDKARLAEILEGLKLDGFNAIFDGRFTKKDIGANLTFVWDAKLAERVYYMKDWGNELKKLYAEYIDPNEPVYRYGDMFSMSYDMYDAELVGGYGAVDAMKHRKLANYQREHVPYESALKVLYELEIPLLHKLIEVTMTGIAVHEENCLKLQESLRDDLVRTEKILREEYDGVNPNSGKQVAELLYDKMKLPTIEGRATREGVLAQLRGPDGKRPEVIDLILEYREVKKGLGTYAEKMLAWAIDGRLYYDYNQVGAETGRMSSSDPNMQNIPKDNRYRAMFKATDGYTMCSWDYSQQEVYVLAAWCKDPALLEAIRRPDFDFYQLLASKVYNLPYEDCSKHGPHKAYRNQMKSVSLGLNYEMSTYSLAGMIGKSVQEAQKIYDAVYSRFPGIAEHRARTHEQVLRDGYAETMFGRRRYFAELKLPDIECDNEEVRKVAESVKYNKKVLDNLIRDAAREGITVKSNLGQKWHVRRQFVNTKVQGTAADMTKLAMLALMDSPDMQRLGMRMLLQVHDEIIVEFPDEYAEEGGRIGALIMQDVCEKLIGIRGRCEPQLMKIWEKD